MTQRENGQVSDIFISYARADRTTAKTLAEALTQQGWSVWWDPKILPGKTSDEVIEEALDAAKCVVVLWSKKSVVSDWVKTEAAEGKRRKILVPALIDEVKIPLEFRRIQAARLIDWRGTSPHPEFDQLLEAVSTILGHPKRPQTPPEEKAVEEKPTAADTLKTNAEETKAKPEAAPAPAQVKAQRGQKQPARGRGLLNPWFVGMGILIIAGIIIVKLAFVDKQPDEEEKPVGTSLSDSENKKITSKPITTKEADVKPKTSHKVPKYNFRSSPATLSVDDVKQMLAEKGFYESSWNKNGRGVVNQFKLMERNGTELVFDENTGLTWQQSGSTEAIVFKRAEAYIVQLNQDSYAGYSNWRLPTLEEVMSLMEPKKQSNGLHINLVFNKKQRWIRTSDKDFASRAWVVFFSDGGCFNVIGYGVSHVRAVR